jgi:hypothetical protein
MRSHDVRRCVVQSIQRDEVVSGPEVANRRHGHVKQHKPVGIGPTLIMEYIVLVCNDQGRSVAFELFK